MNRWSWIPFVLLVGALIGGCGDEKSTATDAPAPAPIPDPTPEPPKPKVGGCNNEDLEGVCHYLGKFALERRPEDPPDHTVYRIEHEIQPKGEERRIPLTSLTLQIPDDKVEQLEAFFQHGHPVSCTAHIVRPPCNPQGTGALLALDPPPFAQPVKR